MFWIKQNFIHPNAKAMKQAPESAGYDCWAPESGQIHVGGRKLIKLGFRAMFTPGYVGLLLDKSGMGNKGITHFAGVIDESYPDEWGAILYNSTSNTFNYGTEKSIIQCVFVKYESTEVQLINDELFEQMKAVALRKGGFGSSGQ